MILNNILSRLLLSVVLSLILNAGVVRGQSFNGHHFQTDTNIFINSCWVRGVIAGDIRNDGNNRIIAGTWQGDTRILVYRYNSGVYQLEWDTAFLSAAEVIPASAGDADNNGLTDFIVTIPSAGTLSLFEWNGTTYSLRLSQVLDPGLSMSMPVLIEDIDEANYRIDRMLTQLRLAGKLHDAAGIVIGNLTNTEPNDPNKQLPINDVLESILLPLHKPILRNVSFGHGAYKATLPLGALAMIDGSRSRLVVTESGVVE